MIVLVDQDGPLADFERGFLECWQRQYPGAFSIPYEARRSFYLRDEYPPHLRTWVDGIYCAPGFYRSLPPTPGCVEAMREMLDLGLDVRICTAPLTRYEHCVLEKYQWTEEHLGHAFTKRMIVTKDKTLVRGAYLIDDRPTVEGTLKPEWEHVLFDCPYNSQIPRKRRLNWSNWREILGV